MRCANCGAEAREGSLFCEKCGSRLENAVPRTVTPEGGKPVPDGDPAQETEGKPPENPKATEADPQAETAEDSAGAGAEPDGKTAENPPGEGTAAGPGAGGGLGKRRAAGPRAVRGGMKRRHFRFPAAAVAIVAAVILAVAAFGLFWAVRPSKTSGQQKEILYYQDDVLYLTEAGGKTDSVKITDSCVDIGISPPEGLVRGDTVSEDGAYLFYREEYDGESYDLYRMAIPDTLSSEKIAANVTSYEPLSGGRAVYMRTDSLYYFDGNESVRLAKRVSDYRIDGAGRNIYWCEKRGNDGNVRYFQDLAGENEKIELVADAVLFYVGGNLDRFLAMKGDVLYLLDNRGENERIAQDVTRIASVDMDAGEFYYMTESPVRVTYSDIIRDMEALTEEERRKLAEKDQMVEIPYQTLHYYRKEGDAVISERCFSDGSETGGVISESAGFCLYMEGPRIEDLQLDWSEAKAHVDDADFGTFVLRQAAERGDFSGLRLAAAERTLEEYDAITGFSQVTDTAYDKERNRLYLNVTDGESETGTLYGTDLKGNDAGTLRELNTETRDIYKLFVSDGGVFYIDDRGENGGDLYWNDREIDFDVYEAEPVGETDLLYVTDYDPDRTGTADFSLQLYTDGKTIRAGRNISFAECAKDGTMVCLTDYDSLKGVGRLVYFDGKDSQILADRVTGFAIRAGSTGIQ